jgi:hypothetical protein
VYDPKFHVLAMVVVQAVTMHTIPGERNDICNILHEYPALQLEATLLAAIDPGILSHRHGLILFLPGTDLLAAQ